MASSLKNYYLEQARRRRSPRLKGEGWISDIFKSTLLPVLKSAGSKAVESGLDIAKDVACEKLQQRGKGIKRKRRQPVAQSGSGKRKRKTKKQVGGSKKRVKQVGLGKKKRKKTISYY